MKTSAAIALASAVLASCDAQPLPGAPTPDGGALPDLPSQDLVPVPRPTPLMLEFGAHWVEVGGVIRQRFVSPSDEILDVASEAAPSFVVEGLDEDGRLHLTAAVPRPVVFRFAPQSAGRPSGTIHFRTQAGESFDVMVAGLALADPMACSAPTVSNTGLGPASEQPSCAELFMNCDNRTLDPLMVLHTDLVGHDQTVELVSRDPNSSARRQLRPSETMVLFLRTCVGDGRTSTGAVTLGIERPDHTVWEHRRSFTRVDFGWTSSAEPMERRVPVELGIDYGFSSSGGGSGHLETQSPPGLPRIELLSASLSATTAPSALLRFTPEGSPSAVAATVFFYNERSTGALVAIGGVR